MSQNEVLPATPKFMKDWGGTHNPRTIQVLLHDNKISPEEAVGRLEHTNKNGILFAGQISTEQALNATNFDHATTWVNRASKNYQSILSKYSTNTEGLSINAEAAFDLAQLPLLGYLACFDELPPQALKRNCYEKSLNIGMQIASKIPDKNSMNIESKRLLGLLSETAVLLLAQRFAINEMGDSSWNAFRSVYSGNHANSSSDFVSNAWDISVYTQHDAVPEISYFVQVKSSKAHYDDREKRYTFGDNITPVYFIPDITLRHDSDLPQKCTINDLANEFNGCQNSKKRLDIRTDLLLEQLG